MKAKMSVESFLQKLRKARIRFQVRPNNTIRTCYGKCPIEALYRYHSHRGAPWFEAAHYLGLERSNMNAIVHAADNVISYTYPGLRTRLLKACGVKA